MTRFNIPSDFPPTLLDQIPGATVDKGQLVFNCDEKSALEAIEKAFEGNKFVAVESKAYTPDDSDMEIAKRVMGNPNFDTSKLIFRELHTCNDLPDRVNDVLEKSFLDELARIVNDESRVILLNHDSRQQVGRKFRANVVNRTFPDGRIGWQLVEYCFLLKDYMTDGSITLGEKVESGVIRDVSIGFMGTGRRWDEGKSLRYWYHEPGKTFTENKETSFVALGAQYFANIAKAAKSFSAAGLPNTIIQKMEKVNLTIGGEVKSFTTEADIQNAFADSVAATKAAETERDALRAEIEGLKTPHISEIIAKQKDLKSEIWDDTTLKALPLAKVKAIADDLGARHKAANPNLNDPSLTKVPGGTGQSEKSATDIMKQLQNL